MDRFVVMVDVGYLLRQSIEIVSSKASTRRGDLEIIDPAGLIRTLVEKSRATLELTDRELLRVYWYDGVMASGLTMQQRSIVELPDLNFRAGIVNSAGQQKGVDSLIVTDLIELASHHAICDAALFTGDSDLAIGIDLAQRKGVRIAVIGLEDFSSGVSHKQSFEITSRADRVACLGGAELTAVMRFVPPRPVASSLAASAALHSMDPASPSVLETTATTLVETAVLVSPEVIRALAPEDKVAIEEIVKGFIDQQASMAGAVDPSTKRIDGAVDRSLIHHVFVKLARGKLTNAEKNFARAALRKALGI